ncbi:hypothetical protein K8I31_06915 [bacterium]|nr:hypothetical protein [bacterium]
MNVERFPEKSIGVLAMRRSKNQNRGRLQKVCVLTIAKRVLLVSTSSNRLTVQIKLD